MRDGSLHKAAVYGSLWETYMWFSERCSGAVWGYGKYQKIKVKEILKREAGRTALEEQTEAYHLGCCREYSDYYGVFTDVSCYK